VDIDVLAFLATEFLVVQVRALVLAGLAAAQAFLLQAVRIPSPVDFPGPVLLEVIAEVHRIIFPQKS
jgi:hypothetical protein